MTSPPRTSLVVFGATGFTGKRVALEVANTITSFHRDIKESSRSFTWAIAGRRKDALQSVLDEIRSVVGANPSNDEVNTEKGLLPHLVEADVTKHDSLLTMAKSTQLVMNCVGPYAHWGEQVVVAVLEASEEFKSKGHPSTHYTDLSGEPNFIERIILKYRHRAKAAGSCILSAAAYDSIPADVGTFYAKEQLGCDVLPSSVEIITQFKTESSIAIHYGTYASAINGFSPKTRKALAETRKQLYSELPKALSRAKVANLGTGIPKRPKRLAGLLTWDEEESVVLVPNVTSDASVVRLAQCLTLDSDPSFDPITPVLFFALPSVWIALVMGVALSLFSFLVKYDFGRSLLLSHPKFFSMGLFSHEGPTKKQLQDTSFVTTLTARGFTQEALSAKQKIPDRKVVIKVRGPEPGYISTPILFVAVARVILSQENKIEKGVSLPGAALRNTNLVQRINDDGRVTFQNVFGVQRN